MRPEPLHQLARAGGPTLRIRRGESANQLNSSGPDLRRNDVQCRICAHGPDRRRGCGIQHQADIPLAVTAASHRCSSRGAVSA